MCARVFLWAAKAVFLIFFRARKNMVGMVGVVGKMLFINNLSIALWSGFGSGMIGN